MTSSPVAAFDVFEVAHWRDAGCALGGPSCLRCRLPQCIEDVPGGARALRLEARDVRARAMHDAGATSREVAEVFGLSLAQVKRVLAGRRTAA